MYVAFLVLTWLALAVGPLARRFVRDRRPAPAVIAVAVVAVMIFAVVDQMPDPILPHADATTAASFASDRSYFAAVEESLPPGAMVYELPYRRFPETVPTYQSADYDLSRPYLNTSTLRWSYGGMKGREAEWQRNLAGKPVPQLLDDLVATGFAGVLVDRFGYPDAAAALEQAAAAATGAAPLVDASGRWAFFDLAGYTAASRTRLGDDALARRADELLYGPRLDVPGCYDVEGSAPSTFQWCQASGSLTVTAERPPVTVRLTATLRAPQQAGTVVMTVDGQRHSFAVGPDPTPIDITFDAGAKVTDIAFRTDVPRIEAEDPRHLYFQLIEPKIVAA